MTISEGEYQRAAPRYAADAAPAHSDSWLGTAWPWLVLAVGVLIIVAGGILFSHF